MKKVLVVDDSKTIRTLCEMIYKGLEDKLLTADSAESARQVISAESPDVVLVDYTLPDADAYEFVASIKDKAAVVMLSGSYAPFDEAKAKASGAVAIIKKPFKTALFFDTIDGLTGAAAPAAQPAAPAPKPVAHVSSVHPAINPSSGIHSAVGSSAIHSAVGSSGVHPAATSASGLHSARRFNFPGVHQDSQPQMAAPSDFAKEPAEHATPKTPVPSISPALQAEAAAINIDPALLRAEVIAAVKSMLPAIVNSYLKKLIQAEVKPQLQNWVDTRVEALIKKMQQ